MMDSIFRIARVGLLVVVACAACTSTRVKVYRADANGNRTSVAPIQEFSFRASGDTVQVFLNVDDPAKLRREGASSDNKRLVDTLKMAIKTAVVLAGAL